MLGKGARFYLVMVVAIRTGVRGGILGGGGIVVV